jgi:hypothetical protein
MRRCPSWTKTTDATIASAMSGKKMRSMGPPFHQAVMPSGRPVRIEAKMRIEIPLPIPRFVICSPIHMSSTLPTVSVTMINTIRPALVCSTPWLRNRKAYPSAWAAESATVRYRVYWLIFA